MWRFKITGIEEKKKKGAEKCGTKSVSYGAPLKPLSISDPHDCIKIKNNK